MSLGAPELQAMPELAGRTERPDRAQLTAFVGNALRQIARRTVAPDQAPIAFVTVPAPVAPIDVALYARDELAPASAGDNRSPAVLWDPPTGPSFAGIGCATDIAATGPNRIAQVAARAETVWARLAHVSFPDIEPIVPRFFGGFAFVEGAANDAPWSSYGDARFVLPAWLYTRTGERAYLSLALDLRALASASDLHAGRGPSETAVTRAIVDRLHELERLLDRLSHGRVAIADGRETPTVISVSDTEPAAWRQQIEDIRAAIADQRCDKIVAARCRVLELSRDIETDRVLRALHDSYPDCYRFAYRFASDSVFVGATPERLITHAGERIATQALAGSIAAGTGAAKRAAAAALLASSKDRSEQDFVVQVIRSVLDPLCSELRVPSAPEIRELRHVLHLETPISGTLARSVHVLELVAALHPTPAVGGVPTAMATDWIAEREPMARGWYAAPVGWFDTRGQGEFAVAIRSGLLRAQTAFIYAGAGIVRDSDPDAEFAETKLKQRPIMSALGIAT